MPVVWRGKLTDNFKPPRLERYRFRIPRSPRRPHKTWSRLCLGWIFLISRSSELEYTIVGGDEQFGLGNR